MADRVARWQALFEEAGKPGAKAFRTYARRRGEDITSTEAQQFVAQQASGQVFAGRLPSDGKVTASREDMRAQADLLDLSKRASSQRDGAAKYALVVVDVFTKELWVEVMQGKTDAETRDAMRKILTANGTAFKEISVDLGREFGPAFEELMKDRGVVVRKKDPQQVSAIAAVDRAQQSLKSILKNIQGDGGWARSIKRAAALYNDREHSALYGAAPDDVSDNKVLQYQLEAEAGGKVKHNNDKWRQKAGRLRDKGAFRVPLDRNTWERIDAPKFGGEVHQVKELVGANVRDEEGQSYPIRQVLAVPGTSADIDVPDELVPGSGRRQEQIQNLRPFADALKSQLSNTPGSEMTLASVTRFLQGRPGFLNTADVYRLPVQGRYVRFLRLFGFELRGSGPGLTVRKPPSAASAAAGSASGQRGRPAGAADIAPRVPRRVMAATQELLWTPDNPYRAGSASHARYELYKGAETVGESRRLGATPQDIKAGIERAYAQLG